MTRRAMIVWAALAAAGCRSEAPSKADAGTGAPQASEQARGATEGASGGASEGAGEPDQGAPTPPVPTAAEAPGAPEAAEPIDPALLITTEDLARELGGIAVLDVRGEAAWETGRVPGALPMPLYALATSAPVRAGRVVVVDPGYGSQALDAVAALRADGRDARLLSGGMAGWCKDARPVEGSCAGVDHMDASSVIADLACPGRVTLLAVRAPGDQERARDLLPGARVVGWTDPADVASAARAVAASTLVIVAETADVDLLRAALPPLPPLVFFADGGIEAVERARQVQRAAATHPAIVTRGTTGAASDQGIRSPKGCGCR